MSVTFSLPALNPHNRFRYRPVSLSRDMCWWFWFGRGAPEKFLDEDYCTSRSGAEFEISKISWNIDAGGPSSDEKWPNSLADANFNALRCRFGHFQFNVTCRDGLGSHRLSKSIVVGAGLESSSACWKWRLLQHMYIYIYIQMHIFCIFLYMCIYSICRMEWGFDVLVGCIIHFHVSRWHRQIDLRIVLSRFMFVVFLIACDFVFVHVDAYVYLLLAHCLFWFVYKLLFGGSVCDVLWINCVIRFFVCVMFHVCYVIQVRSLRWLVFCKEGRLV